MRAAECIDPHYFAVLIGCGATTVNPYLAQDTVADRIARGLIEATLVDAMRRYRAAIDAGRQRREIASRCHDVKCGTAIFG